MSISFDRALGIHEKALGFRTQRAEVLANNIANADTPNFKARDLQIASVLAEQSAQSQRGATSLNRLIRTLSTCKSSNPITQRTRCSSKPVSLCSTANSKGWSAPCAAINRSLKLCHLPVFSTSPEWV